MTTLLAAAPAVQTGRPGDRRLERVPTDRDGSLRPDLIPVAAYLCVEGYAAPEYALHHLAAGETAADLVRIGLLEPADQLAVEVLLSRVRPIRGGAPDDFAAAMDAVEVEAPVPTELVEVYRTPEEWAWRDQRLAELLATMPGDDDFAAWPAF